MRRHIVGLILGSLLTSITVCESAAQQTPSETPSRSFTIRVDASRATRVGEVLKRIAEADEVEVPAGVEPEAFLRELCGNRAPEFERSTVATEAGPATRIRFIPCLRERRDVSTTVRGPIDRPEIFAVGIGIQAGQVTKENLKVYRDGKERSVDFQNLQPGDELVAPSAPAWTPFRAKPDEVRDLEDLITQLATALKCGAEPAEPCLVRQGVVVFEDPSPSPVHPPESSDASAAPTAALPAPADAASAPAPAGAPPRFGGVVDSQWPYDQDLALRALEAAKHELSQTIIGVADGGLATASGAPITPDAFVDTEDYPDPPPSDGMDADKFGYVDDTIGAGVRRDFRWTDDNLGDGDVSICDQTDSPPFGGWSNAPPKASHGSIVASLASARALRSKATPELAAVLPRIVFFRLLGRACDAQAFFGAQALPQTLAFDYFRFRRSVVINLSLLTDGMEGRMLAASLSSLLQYNEELLVLPAGNDGIDLDVTPRCPACLMTLDAYKGADRWTIVVGAADPSLQRTDISNYGDRTVRIYAPGDPRGAVDVSGEDASGAGSQTSYAAPRVALAAAILRAMNINQISRVKNRLRLSTWPLYQDGKPVSRVGVLDLTRVAAAKRDAVEVLETMPDGTLRHRTHVGSLVEGLRGITLCRAGQVFHVNDVHSARLGTRDTDGLRPVHIVHHANLPHSNEARETGLPACRPTGNLLFDDLRDGRLTLPMDEVTQILTAVR